jgi:hypothetical protein
MSADFASRYDGYTLWLMEAAFVKGRSNFCKQKSPHFLSGTFVMSWDFFLDLPVLAGLKMFGSEKLKFQVLTALSRFGTSTHPLLYRHHWRMFYLVKITF